MKKNKDEKNNKYKELYLKLKEAWKDPQKKAGIKLLCYFIFFFIFAILVRVSSNMEITNTNKDTNNKEVVKENMESFREKQHALLNNNHNINYEIKIGDLIYKINGTIKNNIVEGYLESVDSIKKILIKDNILYDVTSGSEEVLDLGFEMSKLNIDYLVNVMEHNDAYIDNKQKIKSYQYAININDITNSIIVYTSDKIIEKIVITDLSSEYILVFDK